jgi:arylsulfatase A-like enzyme
MHAAHLALVLLGVASASLLACADERGDAAKPALQVRPPNVLWVVWDTVRADRMSLYGHERATTPRLEEWAKNARVYDNALSTAGYTLPSHASMFTGLLPGEHCTNNDNKRLAPELITIAEILSDAGYATFLYSANPHISERGQFAQGFDLVEHPWSQRYRDEATRIVLAKLPATDSSSELTEKVHTATASGSLLAPWNIKASGELAELALVSWLETLAPETPYFAFLNYMEAHRPMIPTRAARERVMSKEEVERSYSVDRSWLPMWEYTFGLRDYTQDELDLTAATYDATLTELDDLFADLLERLEKSGHLEDTIVILTADHGEHLGEHHMLDHQYSLYDVLLRVPLVVHYPPALAAGRDASPVMNFDVFATLLDITGLPIPEPLRNRSASLLDPQPDRIRLAENPSGSSSGMSQILAQHPDWDPTPWNRKQRALVHNLYKYIRNSSGTDELFSLSDDPMESRNLISTSDEDRARAKQMEATLNSEFEALVDCIPAPATGAEISEQERRLLEALGYVVEDKQTPDRGRP